MSAQLEQHESLEQAPGRKAPVSPGTFTPPEERKNEILEPGVAGERRTEHTWLQVEVEKEKCRHV